MGYVIAIASSLLLLAGFLALTRYETAHGLRFFAAPREGLDVRIERIEFILAHVDLPAFLREETERIGKKAGHDIAHFVLQAVRAAERFLTRMVRHLRMQERAIARPTREASRDFVKQLSDFKGELGATRPDTSVR